MDKVRNARECLYLAQANAKTNVHLILWHKKVGKKESKLFIEMFELYSTYRHT